MAETDLELNQGVPAARPARQARAHSRTFSLLVIFAFVGVLATWLFLTPDGVLGKPVDPNALLTVVRNITAEA